jgi:hypothetical protein
VAFAEVDTANGGGPPKKGAAKGEAPKETIITNIDPHAGKRGGGGASKKPAVGAPAAKVNKYEEEEDNQ